MNYGDEMNVNRWIKNPTRWVSMDTMSYGDWWIYTPSDPFEWRCGPLKFVEI